MGGKKAGRAGSILTSHIRDHKNRAAEARINTVYMDGCQPAEDTHPAIVLVEAAAFKARTLEAITHEAIASYYQEALDQTETMTNEEQN